MTKTEEQQLLRSVRGLYNYKVRGPVVLLLLCVGFFVFVVGSFLMLGFVGAIGRLLAR
jgi:hypothetical protein